MNGQGCGCIRVLFTVVAYGGIGRRSCIYVVIVVAGQGYGCIWASFKAAAYDAIGRHSCMLLLEMSLCSEL